MMSETSLDSALARLGKASRSRQAAFILLLGLFFIAASASYGGIMTKFALRDGQPRYSIDLLLSGSADKPFAYRVLVPTIVNFLDDYTPPSVKKLLSNEKLRSPSYFFSKASLSLDEKLRYRYALVCGIMFLSLLVSAFAMRFFLHSSGASPLAAALVPTLFLVSFPYLLTVSGFFYDCTELMFLFIALALAIKARIGCLIAVTVLATLNKESFIFYLPALYPVLRLQRDKKSAALSLAACLALAALINLLLKIRLAGLPGKMAENHVMSNLAAYLSPSAYFRLEYTYGIPGPGGAFFLTLLVLLILVARGWKGTPGWIRQNMLVNALISIPLFLLFCATGELRNLSFLYPGLIALMAVSLDELNQAAPAGFPLASREGKS